MGSEMCIRDRYGHVCAFEVAVWPRCRRVKGRKRCPESISPTVVCLHVTAHARGFVPACDSARAGFVTAHVRGSCLHVTAHVRGSPTSCDSCPYSRHDQSHALTTQELRDIRNAEKTREIIFFWLPAALLSTFTFYYEATTPWTALGVDSAVPIATAVALAALVTIAISLASLAILSIRESRR